jgi:hypothetical protein
MHWPTFRCRRDHLSPTASAHSCNLWLSETRNQGKMVIVELHTYGCVDQHRSVLLKSLAPLPIQL